MRRVVQLFLCLALAFSLSLAVNALADTDLSFDVELLGSNPNATTATFAVLPEDNGRNFLHDTFAGNVWIPDDVYGEIEDAQGGAPEWSIVEVRDYDDLGVEMEQYDDRHQGANIRVNSTPTHSGTATITIACDWGDLHCERQVQFRYVNTNGTPDGCDIPDRIDLKVGVTSEFTWNFNGYNGFQSKYWFPWNLRYRDNDGLFEFYNDGNTVYITPLEGSEGVWPAWINICDQNVGVHVDTMFCVADANGNVPAPEPHYEEGDVNDEPLYLFEDNDDTGLHHQNTLAFTVAQPEYDALCALYGEPSWDVWREEDGNSVNWDYHWFTWDEEGNNRRVYIEIDQYPENPSEGTIYANCEWHDGNNVIAAYGVLNMSFQNLNNPPQMLWIEGLDDGIGIHELKIGEESAIHMHWDTNAQYADRTWVDIDADFERDNHWEWDEGVPTQYITPYESGTFRMYLALNQANLRMEREFLAYVQDENGNESDIMLRFEQDNDYEYDINFALFEDADGVWHDDWVNSWTVEESSFNALRCLYGEPEWRWEYAEDTDTSAKFRLDEWDDRRGAELRVEKNPYRECDTKVYVTCDWPDYSITGEVTVHFSHVDSLPTGDGMPDECDMQVGQPFEIPYSLQPEDYPFDSRRFVDVGMNDENIWDYFDLDYVDDGNNGTSSVFLTPREPGVYYLWVHNVVGNICEGGWTIANVKDENGNDPYLNVRFEGDDYEDRHVTRYLFDDNDETGLHSLGYTASFDFDKHTYDVLRATHGDPEWTCKMVGDNADDDIWNYWFETADDSNDNRCIFINVGKDPDHPCTGELEVTCFWPDTPYSATGHLTIHFEDIDENDLPTGLYLEGFDGNELHGLQVGQETTFVVDWIPEGYHGGPWVDFDHNFDCDCWQDREDNENWEGKCIQHVVPYESGIFTAHIALNDVNLRISRDILLFVNDEDGNEPGGVEPILDYDEQNIELTLATGDTESDSVFLEKHVFYIRLENYDVIRTYYGEDPWWEFHATSDEAPWVRIEDREDNRAVEIIVEDYPDHDVSADYVLRLMIGDQEIITRDVHIDFVKTDIFPTGINYYTDNENGFDMTVGQTIDIYASFDPEDYQPILGGPWINMGINDFSGDLDDYLRFERDEYDPTLMHVTAYQPGTYVAWIDCVDGNICATTFQTVAIRVSDENGDVPVLNPEFDDEYEMTMASVVNNPGDIPYWRSDGDVLFIRPHNEESLRGLYGDDYEWSFETVDGDAQMYTKRTDEGEFDMCVGNLDDIQPGSTSVVEATMHYGEGWVTFPITIHFTEMTLPNYVEWPTQIDMRAGEECDVLVNTDLEGWHEGFLWLDIDDYDWKFDKWNDDEDSYVVHMWCDDPNQYTGCSHIHADNVFLWGNRFTVNVSDENGDVPMPEIEFERESIDLNFGLVPQSYNNQYGVYSYTWVTDLHINNSATLAAVYGDDFEWSVDQVSGEDLDAYIGWQRGDACNLNIDHQPTREGKVEFNVRLRYGDENGQHTVGILPVTLNVIDAGQPTGAILRDGEDNEIGDTIEVQRGEQFTITSEFNPDPDWRIPDREDHLGFYVSVSGYGWEEDEMPDNPYVDIDCDGFTAYIWPEASCTLDTATFSGNILVHRTIQLIVKDGEEPIDYSVLNLPRSLREIESEAFEGGSFNVIRIHDGCETIGSRAFANCGNLVKVYIPYSVYHIADDAFDNCGGFKIITENPVVYEWAQGRDNVTIVDD